MNDEEELNLPVPVAVPMIIGKAQFQRIAARRTERSPRKNPPLHVNPKTLLTGLCKCGYCNSSMHIATGKSGRYRYLKCNKRNVQSTTSCASPNVPYEKFEKLALRCILEHLLTDARLETILDDCRSNADALSKTQGPERKQIIETKVQVQRKLKNLYKLVEDEKIIIDSVLGERIQDWQDELNEPGWPLQTPPLLAGQIPPGRTVRLSIIGAAARKARGSLFKSVA
ncbi:recombinase zinc beta ribbon domain-containing protein, partial [Alcaligenaceae bacterium]|nr:recombinase zinc beta ribbon domain-containing protein [Alcaligenaceae bacterium]